MNGVRSEGADYFDDVLEAEENAGSGGILDSAGLRDYDNIKTSVEQAGLKVRMNCRNCNDTRNVYLEWMELMQIAGNSQGAPIVLPAGWRFSQNNHTTYQPLPCPRCGKPESFSVHITPDDARKHVQQGIDAGFIDPRKAEHVRQQVIALQQRQLGR